MPDLQLAQDRTAGSMPCAAPDHSPSSRRLIFSPSRGSPRDPSGSGRLDSDATVSSALQPCDTRNSATPSHASRCMQLAGCCTTSAVGTHPKAFPRHTFGQRASSRYAYGLPGRVAANGHAQKAGEGQQAPPYLRRLDIWQNATDSSAARRGSKLVILSVAPSAETSTRMRDRSPQCARRPITTAQLTDTRRCLVERVPPSPDPGW